MTDNEKDIVEGLRLAGDSLFDNAADMIESLCAELERVTKERDAAVEDFTEHGKDCATCARKEQPANEEPCKSCCKNIWHKWPNWQWRGVKMDEEVQHV